MTIIAQLKVTSSSSGWYMIISLCSCRAVPKQSESGEGLEQIFAQYLLDLATDGCHVEKTYKALVYSRVDLEMLSLEIVF